MRVTLENIDEVLAQLGREPVLAFDCETTGLELTDYPFALVVTSPKDTYYFDTRIVEWRSHPGVQELFAQDKAWVAQNFKFDARMLKSSSIGIGGIWADIAVAARIVDNQHQSYSLENQAKRRGEELKIDIKPALEEHGCYEQRVTKLGETIKHPRYDWVPIDLMEPYACQDGKLTLDLYNYYLSLMDEQDRAVFEQECAVTKVCFKMEQTGIFIDRKYTQEAYDFENAKCIALKEQFRAQTGLEYVNSAKHLCPIFEKLGERIAYTTKGELSLTDDVLSTYTTPLAKLVQEIRFFDKRVSTYYGSYLNKAHLDKIHPTMWQAGTRTGRFSYSDPNLQNIPKEDDGKYHVRRCFVPSTGNAFVSFDYAQMEYRLCAAYAGETAVVRQVMGGADFHQVTADAVGVDRSTAKTLNFATLYGAGLQKIADMLGISKDAAKRLKTKFFLGMPKVEEFIRNVIATGKSRGYVINWLGRKLRSDYEFCFALPNHLIQGGGADIVKAAMVRIDVELPDASMVLQVHDQLVFDMHPSQFVHIPRIKEIMESIWEKNGMRLAVDVEHSFVSFDSEDMIKGAPTCS